MSWPEHAHWVSLLAAAAGSPALSPLFGLTVSPVVRRAVEIVEYLALAAVVPMACWVGGLYGLVRGYGPAMTDCRCRGWRDCSACALLAVFPLYTAPEATAVTPPTVDESLLPKPGSPAPPQRTEQHEPCVAATTAPSRRGKRDQLKDLGLQAVWQLTRGAGQTVAVIDTGVSRHRLLPHLVPGGDYVSTGDGTEDCDGHGTIVAGIVGAAPDPHDANASAASHPTPRSSASASRATGSGPPTIPSAPASAMSRRWRWRCAPPPTWARR